MDYAIVVYFDKEVDLSISQIMKNISCAGVNSYMLDVGIRPHITLAAFRDINPQEISKWLRTYADTIDCFNIKFSNVGVFLANHSVLFLAPVIEQEFIDSHKNFNMHLEEVVSDFETNYLPGKWVPHCTLATRLNQSEVHQALDVVFDDFRPFTAKVNQIGFIQCNPYKEVITYEIGSR